jgi:hypothetical protein
MEEICGPMVSSVSGVSDILWPTAERMNEIGIALRGIMLTLAARNRGELAEGWYDPSTKNKAEESASYERSDRPSRHRASPDYGVTVDKPPVGEDEDSDDDVVGPTLPGQRNSGRRSGPTIPRMDDLELRRGKLPQIVSSLRIPQLNFSRQRNGNGG